MAYRTHHTLEVWGESDIDHKEKISEKYQDGYFLFDEDVKWYTYREDMKEYSKLYPDLVFMLKGVGAENGDMWVEYFKNGKSQYCPAIITFENFDESKLR